MDRVSEVAFVLVLVASAAGYFLDAPVAGSFCLAIAFGFALLRWTRIGGLLRSRISHQRNVRDAILAELVAAYDEGQSLDNAYTQIDNAAYTFWRDKTAAFIEAVLCPDARQRFLTPHSGYLAERLRALAELRDDPGRWNIRVDRDVLEEAKTARRSIDDGEGILVAGTPLEPPRLRTLAQGLYRRGQAIFRDPFGVNPQAKADWVSEVTFTLHNEGRKDLAAGFESAPAGDFQRSWLGLFGATQPQREQREMELYLRQLHEIIDGLT